MYFFMVALDSQFPRFPEGISPCGGLSESTEGCRLSVGVADDLPAATPSSFLGRSLPLPWLQRFESAFHRSPSRRNRSSGASLSVPVAMMRPSCRTGAGRPCSSRIGIDGTFPPQPAGCAVGISLGNLSAVLEAQGLFQAQLRVCRLRRKTPVAGRNCSSTLLASPMLPAPDTRSSERSWKMARKNHLNPPVPPWRLNWVGIPGRPEPGCLKTPGRCRGRRVSAEDHGSRKVLFFAEEGSTTVPVARRDQQRERRDLVPQPRMMTAVHLDPGPPGACAGGDDASAADWSAPPSPECAAGWPCRVSARSDSLRCEWLAAYLV